MYLIAAISLTCWACALVAVPRRPRAGDEVQELVYRRLVGRHQILLGCAAVATLGLALMLALQAVGDMG